MIRIFYGYKTENILNRKIEAYVEYEETVKKILQDVRERGDKAVLEYGEKFDGAKLDSLEVADEEFEQAEKCVSKEFKDILHDAMENIAFFHKYQLKSGFRIEKENGVVLGQKYTPVEKAGIYVPGGTASYPSTVLMNVIPAKIAGVSEIVVTTPVKADGKIKPEILVAAKMSGVTKIFKTGGAQAIGALAYGTQTVPKVDKIVGPGNIYVALAKKQVFGRVGIDMIAGPSEILVVADKYAEPKHVAIDMLSQAEHDKLATAVLVTDSEELALAVRDEIETALTTLARRDIARASIDNNCKIIVVDNIEQAIAASNMIAPEHLELCVENAFQYLDKVKNAGSVFVGYNTPEALGDYFAGPNHTLPTNGSARFSSPLSVDDFVKKTSYIHYPLDALNDVGDSVAAFALKEGLEAHAKSVISRKQR